jgi:parallel beta-helix repeat protein
LLRGKRDSFPCILLLKRNNITIEGNIVLSNTYIV